MTQFSNLISQHSLLPTLSMHPTHGEQLVLKNLGKHLQQNSVCKYPQHPQDMQMGGEKRPKRAIQYQDPCKAMEEEVTGHLTARDPGSTPHSVISRGSRSNWAKAAETGLVFSPAHRGQVCGFPQGGRKG